MRLDFNILWVEDNVKNVLSQRDKIDRMIRKEGFRLQVEFPESIVKAKEYLKSDIFGDHIDLVLMDYELGAGGRGDDGLVEVRKIFPYKDLMFYSSQAADLASLVAKKQVEGVFCSTRDDLPDEVIGLFETLIKKVLDIDHSRGIVMGSSSDIDGLVFDSLGAHFRKNEGKLSDVARNVIAEQLKEIRKSFEKVAEKLSIAATVEELYDLHIVYSSAHRHKLLRKVLETINERDAICQALSNYAANTMPKRNDLAHIQVKKQGFSRKLFNRKGIELTAESVRQLRLDLLEHQETLEQLFDELAKP
jgi:CheY-like chemotaxis protein